MPKNLFIAEKPSVAREFAKALKINAGSYDGYMESPEAIITWCVGHLVTMSYPEAYDEKYKKWSFDTIPFIPETFRYEVISGVKKQFDIVSGLLNRPDVAVIYVCTDSGREGEYIYRLVEQMAGVRGKQRRRVWIDSQTEEEILRGIREAKDLSEYDSLGDAAYLRAKEDYLMGINFSRVLTLKYGRNVKEYLKRDKAVISVGRVMTCVLGMVVKREREIRSFVKTPFYRVLGSFCLGGEGQEGEGRTLTGEWKALEGSRYFASPLLYKENGFRKEETARELIRCLEEDPCREGVVKSIERKKESKKPPLLYNLAELQNDCSRYFKISPDETLRIAQELYEKKLTTYPRTDARVLSSAVAKEIHKNLGGLARGLGQSGPYGACAALADQILSGGLYGQIGKSRYVDDKQITDHYAIIPTGQGMNALGSLSPVAGRVYELILRRFLSVFFPPAEYQKVTVVLAMGGEQFTAGFKVLVKEGYLQAAQAPFMERGRDAGAPGGKNSGQEKEKGREADREKEPEGELEEVKCDAAFMGLLQKLKKGDRLPAAGFEIKEGETTPPKRYNSGSMILTMENAGQFIEDEELRSQIKGSGIGTSATRAEILKKLVNIEYLALNKKTQIITPTLMGEMVYDVVDSSIRPLLNPALTASWEKGLTQVASGDITSEEYMRKLEDFVTRRTNIVKQLSNQNALFQMFRAAEVNYRRK